MSYLPFARKYRPSRFDEVLGQDHVRDSLMAAVKLGRQPHGVILHGIRGVGKTTLARLYASALNCVEGPTHEPCGKCEHCQAIASGTHVDVMEIDGASHTGVDDIRALQETVYFAPQRSTYKVYLIDEVHMLSNSAFNALLKTLEEPPENVVFVFATTEINKVPNTIISRCQTYALRKIRPEIIQQNLRMICEAESIDFDQSGLDMIADISGGSLRDALTALDQSYVLCAGKIQGDKIRKFFALADKELIEALYEGMVSRNKDQILETCTLLTNEGVDFQRTVGQLLRHINHICTKNQVGSEVFTLFSKLLDLYKSLDGSSLDSLVFENCLLEWVYYQKETGAKREVSPAVPGAHIQSAERQAPVLKSPEKAQVKIQQNLKSTGKLRKEDLYAEPVSKFPATWRGMIDAWKKQKPLQGRQLEDLYLIAYNAQKIVLEVDAGSLAAKGLLKDDSQLRMKNQMNHLFDFEGELFISARVSDGGSVEEPVQEIVHGQDASIEHSLLDVKKFEKNEADQKLKIEAREHPLTQKILNEFGLNIDKIDIVEP